MSSNGEANPDKCTKIGKHFPIFDEITAAKSDWPQAIARLRDTNLAFKQDCVVLTGSSSRGLVEATKALAGRRGSAARSDRLLLPMGFRNAANQRSSRRAQWGQILHCKR